MGACVRSVSDRTSLDSNKAANTSDSALVRLVRSKLKDFFPLLDFVVGPPFVIPNNEINSSIFTNNGIAIRACVLYRRYNFCSDFFTGS